MTDVAHPHYIHAIQNILSYSSFCGVITYSKEVLTNREMGFQLQPMAFFNVTTKDDVKQQHSILQLLMRKCKFRWIISYIWYFSLEYCLTLDSLDCWTSCLHNKHIWCCSDGSEGSGRTVWWNPEVCDIFLSTSHYALDLTAFRHGVKTHILTTI